MKKGKRYIKVPLNLCRPMNELSSNEHLEYIGFYSKEIDSKEYLIDIKQTTSNNYYVQITDVTDGNYKPIDLDWFKDKYGQPSLFDFFDI